MIKARGTQTSTDSLTGKRVWVAGHCGMVGQALMRRLATEDCTLLTVGRKTLDLTDQAATQAWVADQRPDVIFIAAARVGGILANRSAPVEFLGDNLLIVTNICRAAHAADVARLVFIGSSAVYPQFANQPIVEESLLTGPTDPNHDGYAMAKIAGIKLTQAYHRQYGRKWFSVLPTNLYGPGDNYDLETSHVLPALLRKVHEAKTADSEVTLWGSGAPLREFLHADDLADALVHLTRVYEGEGHLNVGSGSEISIRALAEMIADIVGYAPALQFDTTKPDGTLRKLLDCSKLHALGWSAARPLRDGIADTYKDWRKTALQEAHL